MKEGLKILMLEDNATDAELIQRLLKKEKPGSTFHHAATQQEFMEALVSFDPEVILADNSLPQFDAAEALRIVRQLEMQIPFIMVSGTLREEYAVNIIRKGADDYILKDSMLRLPAAIDAALNYRKTEKEKKDALQSLVQSEEKYRAMVARISDAFIALDKDWRYTYLNEQAGELIHRKPAELVGKIVWEEFPDAVGSSTYDAFHQAMKEQRYIANTDYYAPLDLWQENHIYPSPEGLSVFIRNITEKKKLELALLEQQRKEQLNLTAAALDAQEVERNAIAIELHDNVNQVLAGVNVLLHVLQDHPERTGELLPVCIENMMIAIEENRKIAHGLVAPDLEKETLVQQLSNLCEYMLHPAGIESFIQQESFDETRLSDKQLLTVYRISQEQCTNIIKYSKARSVRFTLDTTGNFFTLRITDDGEGADMDKLKKGIGLRNINSRLSVFGGHLEVDTKPGSGFVLEITMPVGDESNE